MMVNRSPVAVEGGDSSLTQVKPHNEDMRFTVPTTDYQYCKIIGEVVGRTLSVVLDRQDRY